jgi:hypothetical protein
MMYFQAIVSVLCFWGTRMMGNAINGGDASWRDPFWTIPQELGWLLGPQSWRRSFMRKLVLKHGSIEPENVWLMGYRGDDLLASDGEADAAAGEMIPRLELLNDYGSCLTLSVMVGFAAKWVVVGFYNDMVCWSGGL